MIKEAYCSYEVAKLLKEKGFDWDCITYYVDYESDDVKYSMLFENNTTWEERCCSAPTHQMAMRWLREEHNIDIITFHEFLEHSFYWCRIEEHPYTLYQQNIEYKTYEEAVEAAIKYTLENLI